MKKAKNFDDLSNNVYLYTYMTPQKKSEELESLSTGSQLSKDKKRPYNKRTSEKVKRWTLEETTKYETFIKTYADVFTNNSSKRVTKIFILMSEFISTKTPSQCRSHHQKFFKKLMKLNNDENANAKKKLKKTTYIKTKIKLENFEEKGDEPRNDSIAIVPLHYEKTSNLEEDHDSQHFEEINEKAINYYDAGNENYEYHQNLSCHNINNYMFPNFNNCNNIACNNNSQYDYGNFTDRDDLEDFESKNGEKSSFLFNENKNVFQEINFNNFEEIFFNSSLKNARPIDY